jgi:putative membrane protein
MKNLLLKIASAAGGIWLAVQFIPGVQFNGSWKVLLLAGVLLGLVNVFIKPVVNLITLPIRILTLGLTGFVVNMAIIWLADLYFAEIIIQGLIPLFWTSLMITGLNIVLSLIFKITDKVAKI